MAIIKMPPRTFQAKLFEAAGFTIAGTLDGFIDVAVPGGKTYPLTLDEVQALVTALQGAVTDIKVNCLYDEDSFLRSRGE